jgi:hypothetical protein
VFFGAWSGFVLADVLLASQAIDYPNVKGDW